LFHSKTRSLLVSAMFVVGIALVLWGFFLSMQPQHQDRYTRITPYTVIGAITLVRLNTTTAVTLAITETGSVQETGYGQPLGVIELGITVMILTTIVVVARRWTTSIEAMRAVSARAGLRYCASCGKQLRRGETKCQYCGTIQIEFRQHMFGALKEDVRRECRDNRPENTQENP